MISPPTLGINVDALLALGVGLDQRASGLHPRYGQELGRLL